MIYNFDTDSLPHAKAALILYAVYRSRPASSPLNGLETWDRFASFIHGAWLKSETTAEFVQNLCHKAKTGSIRPDTLTDGPVELPTGELIESDTVKDFRLSLFSDDSLLPLLDKERIYLLLLVRERIQRERMEGQQ